MPSVLSRLKKCIVHYFIERRYGLDTEKYEHLEDYGVSSEGGKRVRYVPSGWLDFRRIAKVANFTKDDVFVDFGSGKGRMVFLAAASHPFKKVIGVELLEAWNDIARVNIEKNLTKLKCQNVTLVTTDVLDYEIPNEMTVAYFFEPFGGDIFEAVMQKIKHSLETVPRNIWVIYQSANIAGRPKLTETLDRCNWLKMKCRKVGKVKGYDFYFYQSVPEKIGKV